MAKLLQFRKCETCLGAGQLIQDSGPMTGFIISCPDCAGTYEDFSNNYGTDTEDCPEIYVDQFKGISGQVKENHKTYLKLMDGTEIELHPPTI